MKRSYFSSILNVFLLALLLGDLAYSAAQYYGAPMDGDMVGGLLPVDDVIPVLNDPFGISVWTEGKEYANPNRFFSHYVFFTYYDTVPFFLQGFVEPIDSLYLSNALIKLFTHLGLLLVIGFVTKALLQGARHAMLLSMVLATPFFQTHGYVRYMGIIDPATTYVFFYALPFLLLLLYLLPFFILEVFEEKANPIRKWEYAVPLLAPIVCLSGPLNTGAVLVLCMLIFLLLLRHSLKNPQTGASFSLTRIPKRYWLHLLPLALFAVYSLLVGKANTLDVGHEFELLDVYGRLPLGMYYSLTQKPGFLFLLLGILILYLIGKKSPYQEFVNKMQKQLKWIGLFALVYILLLPLGGYREYRPNTLRYDTLLPITFALIYVYVQLSCFFALKLHGKLRIFHVGLATAIGLIFTLADKPFFRSNECERNALETIAAASEPVVELEKNCSPLSWEPVTDPAKSRLKGELLYRWNILDQKKEFYVKTSIQP